MTETKRDVFEDLVEELANAYIALDGEGIGEDLTNEDKQAYLKDYDIALPDDLPVIPKEISDRLKQAKADRSSLRYMFAASSINMLSDWWMAQDPENEDTFARAWLLGVWRVEETGEVVKL
nr:MAG TPA: Protein of unknown function (DUF1642) [Caudoviricetes sp.]